VPKKLVVLRSPFHAGYANRWAEALQRKVKGENMYGDEVENIRDNSHSWVAWKNEAELWKRKCDGLYFAQHHMHLTAFGAFLVGGFVGGILMLIVLVGLYGGR
jgi:hypothetical protein